MHDHRLRRCYGYGVARLTLCATAIGPREDTPLRVALAALWHDGGRRVDPRYVLRLAGFVALLTVGTTLLYAAAARRPTGTPAGATEMVWLAASRPLVAAERASAMRARPLTPPEPAPSPKPDVLPAPAPELRVDPAPALPRGLAAVRSAEFRAPRLIPSRTSHPDADLLAIDSLGAERDPPDTLASAGRSPRPTSLRPVAAPARPAVPKAVASSPPAPPASPGPPDPTHGVSRLAGVPLSALARCAEDSEEDRLKERVLTAVPRASRCDSVAGTYHFLQTQNLNAFLMRIERSADRDALDRCAELGLALRCLAANGRKELGS